MYSIPLVVKNMNVLCLIEMLNLKKMFLFWYVSVRLAWDTVIKENVEDCSIYMSDWTEVLFNYAPLCPSHCQCIVTTPTSMVSYACHIILLACPRLFWAVATLLHLGLFFVYGRHFLQNHIYTQL